MVNRILIRGSFLVYYVFYSLVINETIEPMALICSASLLSISPIACCRFPQGGRRSVGELCIPDEAEPPPYTIPRATNKCELRSPPPAASRPPLPSPGAPSPPPHPWADSDGPWPHPRSRVYFPSLSTLARLPSSCPAIAAARGPALLLRTAGNSRAAGA